MREDQERARSLRLAADSDQHRPQPFHGTSADGLSRLGCMIEFLLPGSGEDYLDLANIYLIVRAKVVNGDGSNVDTNDPVGPVNNWLHSLFSQVDVYLNDTLVITSNNTYAYRAYIETLLSYDTEPKGTQLSSLWYKDTCTHMDAVDIADGDIANLGFVARRTHLTQSHVVEMVGRLPVDLCMQDRFLINGVDVKIRLVRNKDAFALLAGVANPQYKTCIVDSYLFAKKATLNLTVQMAHIKALEKSTVKYLMRSVDCKVYSIPAGANSHKHDNLFLGTLPKRLVLCYIDKDAYNGSLCTSTDDWDPAKPLQPDFGNNAFVRSYLNLFTSTCKIWQDEGNGLTRSDFRHGYTFLGFDLTPDACDGWCFHLVRKGNLRVEMHLVNPLPQTVNVVVYAEFESVLEIDKNRIVIYDY